MICLVELANEMSARSADRGKKMKIRYGPLPQVRDGAGNDDKGSGGASHGQENHVAGSGGDHRHQRPANAPVAWTLAALRLGRIAGPKTGGIPASGACRWRRWNGCSSCIASNTRGGTCGIFT